MPQEFRRDVTIITEYIAFINTFNSMYSHHGKFPQEIKEILFRRDPTTMIPEDQIKRKVSSITPTIAKSKETEIRAPFSQLLKPV